MQPFLAMITPLTNGGPVDPGWSGGVAPPGQEGGRPSIWGPGDPRPTNPIAGWNPGTGTWPQPPGGGQPPLGMWGPNDPRPTLPIAGWNPGTGTWPQPNPNAPHPEHPINQPPTEGAQWTQIFVYGVGWVWAIIPGLNPQSPPEGGEGESATPKSSRRGGSSGSTSAPSDPSSTTPA